jgi:F-type H+-transporting ATPase subunit b
MSINATVIIRIIMFAIFVWFCMKFIWPRLITAIKDRQKMVVDGLATADHSQREMKATQRRVIEPLDEAEQQSRKR